MKFLISFYTPAARQFVSPFQDSQMGTSVFSELKGFIIMPLRWPSADWQASQTLKTLISIMTCSK